MSKGIRFVGSLAALCLAGSSLALDFAFLKVNPRATYLRDSQWAPAATSLEVNPTGRADLLLQIRTVGWYNRAFDDPASHNVSNEAVAVFSEDGSLDSDWSKQNRVVSPIDYGPEFYTLPTWVGNLPTDINQDFGFGPSLITLQVPESARFILFSPFDNGFWNNVDDFSMVGADPRGFGVEWNTIQVQNVPEPGAVVALALGLGGMIRRRAKAAGKVVPAGSPVL